MGSSFSTRRRESWRRKVVVPVATAAVLVAPLGSALAANSNDSDESRGFRKAVTVAGAQEHLSSLQALADANGGTRASGTAGFDASADYVFDRLTAAGYAPRFQPFEFPFYRELSTPVLERTDVDPDKAYTAGSDFATMTYSGSGDTTAAVSAVDLTIPPAAVANSSTSGCEATDFAGFPAGDVALMQRGTCTFAAKATNADNAGASAVIIFNEGQPGRTAVIAGTLGSPGYDIPVVGASFVVGQELSNGVQSGVTGTAAHVRTETESEIRETVNVIAETATGDPDRTVVIGAHLDSVVPGPGINDNGTGSSGILEVAETFAAQDREARNRLRFIWFGAEELGLLGSRHYVGNLSQAEKDQILLNLNFDMIGSPNFVRFVYDGDGTAGPKGPAGSGYIEKVFVDYFASQGLASDPTPFNGRSDYGPFIAAGIPAGGLFTGAEGVKTAAQAATYGGEAGVAYDKCYHQVCDTVDNVNRTGLDQMLDAVAHATLFFSRTKNAVDTDPAAPVGGTGTGGGGGLHDHDHELLTS
jgi:Zn-dependent M28 family amino/carboxypeptidase